MESVRAISPRGPAVQGGGNEVYGGSDLASAQRVAGVGRSLAGGGGGGPRASSPRAPSLHPRHDPPPARPAPPGTPAPGPPPPRRRQLDLPPVEEFMSKVGLPSWQKLGLPPIDKLLGDDGKVGGGCVCGWGGGGGRRARGSTPGRAEPLGAAIEWWHAPSATCQSSAADLAYPPPRPLPPNLPRPQGVRMSSMSQVLKSANGAMSNMVIEMLPPDLKEAAKKVPHAARRAACPLAAPSPHPSACAARAPAAARRRCSRHRACCRRPMTSCSGVSPCCQAHAPCPTPSGCSSPVPPHTAGPEAEAAGGD